MIYAEGDHRLARYGALARDGITCTVCHHIAPEGLGSPKSFTGQFAAGKADELYGPYSDAIKAEPMKQALGITPRGSEHIKRAAMCGSCHTVILPQLPANYRRADLAEASIGQIHEQTTYLEWQNSAYQDERDPGKESRTCQSCHMPILSNKKEQSPRETDALPMKIANIEEYLPGIPSSLPESAITLAPRRPYARHTLTGINLFVMQMFSQFAGVLGVARRDPLAGAPSFLSSLKLVQREALALAQQATARVEFTGPPRIVKNKGRDAGRTLVVTVRVTNLAGHKFPSGVGFRRAFLAFQVLSQSGQVLWASGATNNLGVILGPDGSPLPSEFTLDPAELEPHHERITRPTEVQIYEERTTDDRGRLTTSFLSLFKRVKDNRLLPQGWSPVRRGTASMQPVNLDGSKLYKDGRNYDEVTYAIPIGSRDGITEESAAQGRWTVQATLYYQSIPPYYLRDRFSAAKGQETQRLYLFSRGLNAAGAIENWKLLIGATDKVPVE